MTNFVPSPLLAYDEMPNSWWETQDIAVMTQEFVADIRAKGYTVKYIPNPVSVVYDNGDVQRVVIAASSYIETAYVHLERRFKGSDDDIVYMLCVYTADVIDLETGEPKVQRIARFGHSQEVKKNVTD